MKKTIGLCFSVMLATSSLISAAQAYERVELDHARTSIEYSGPIESVAKVIEGYRWLGQTKEMNGGVVFEAYDNKYFGRADTSLGNAIMVKATFYTYDQVSKEAIMIARQSEITGFVELYGMESPELQMHIQTVGENEFQAFSSKYDSDKPQKLMTYKKVEQFNKNPHGERLKSASDSGMVF
ncbi:MULTISPECIES: hypothetical protein [Pseudomonas]|uniref:hypothetical protein n=1 Tax=Pseudomonas TaxID=286 RepID=UPI0015F9916C|nr:MULTISPECIES: hypothetical protein [Pseudomonas]MBA6137679.1 hypothetical protein [Pseudomonas monteilii]MDH1695761.1 hypothetical protein [Pseudomonas sp. GD03766]MDT3747225.1 hypothetical protein [Pseudomonas kurunegalensis]